MSFWAVASSKLKRRPSQHPSRGGWTGIGHPAPLGHGRVAPPAEPRSLVVGSQRRVLLHPSLLPGSLRETPPEGGDWPLSCLGWRWVSKEQRFPGGAGTGTEGLAGVAGRPSMHQLCLCSRRIHCAVSPCWLSVWLNFLVRRDRVKEHRGSRRVRHGIVRPRESVVPVPPVPRPPTLLFPFWAS